MRPTAAWVGGLLLAASTLNAQPRAPRFGLDRAPRAERSFDLEVQDGDVKDVLRMMARAGGVDVVVSERVQGKVNLRFSGARWADAMAAVLQSQGLGAELEGTLLYVDTLAHMKLEAEARAARLAATEALVPLTTRIFVINYARAAELAPRVKALLSERGQVQVDERTNTLIVTDIATRTTRVGALVQSK